jgi:hypothetical protein
MWDEIYEICVDYEKREIENNFSSPWRGLELYHSRIKSWKLACETLREEYRIEFDNLIKGESSIESICNENIMLQMKLKPSLFFSPQLPRGRTIRMDRIFSKVARQDGDEQVEDTGYTWSELFHEILSMKEDYPFLLTNFHDSFCKLMIFEGSLIFTDIKFDYRTTVLETWNVIESIQNRRWIEMNWNPELEKKTKSIRERLEQEQAEIDRKISIHENIRSNKASAAEMAEYFTIVTEFLSLQNSQAENKNLLKLDLHKFAMQQRIGIEDWTFHPINLDYYRSEVRLKFRF